jgi:pimeloyl-ACP methyl ester carboxylesterase
MLRSGSGEPLVLLHGVTNGERVWHPVVPLLGEHHDVIVPVALAHHGGRKVTKRPVDHLDVLDDAERTLDELGLEAPHLAGNSMGGWVAIDLARRGRAKSVCALSPAGLWDSDEARTRVLRFLVRNVRDTRRARPVLGQLSRSKGFRRWALRKGVAYGDRVSRADFIALVDEALGGECVEDIALLKAELEPLDPPPCPITIAWAEHDRVFPSDPYMRRAREMVPGAKFVVLDDVGHVPMLDDPRLVAETILGVTGAASSAAMLGEGPARFGSAGEGSEAP